MDTRWPRDCGVLSWFKATTPAASGDSHRGGMPAICWAGTRSLWMVACIIWLLCAGGARAQIDCSDPDLVYLWATSNCVKHLESSTQNALRGQLTSDDRLSTCKAYNDTMDCLWSLQKKCQMDIDVLNDMIQDIEMGIGQLCTNQKAFNKYLAFSSCYSSQRVSTAKCIHTFEEFIDIHLLGDPSNTNHSQQLCSSLQTLVTCTDDVITDKQTDETCGRQAAHVFHNLLLTKIPNMLSAMCPAYKRSVGAADDATSLSSMTASVLVYFVLLCLSMDLAGIN